MVSKGSGDHREIWNLNLLTQMKLHVFFVSVVFLPGSPMRVDDLFSPPQILMAPVGTRALIEGLFGYPIIPPSLVQSWDPSSLRHCTRLVLPLLYLSAFGKEFIGLLEHRSIDPSLGWILISFVPSCNPSLLCLRPESCQRALRKASTLTCIFHL